MIRLDVTEEEIEHFADSTTKKIIRLANEGLITWSLTSITYEPMKMLILETIEHVVSGKAIRAMAGGVSVSYDETMGDFYISILVEYKRIPRQIENFMSHGCEGC